MEPYFAGWLSIVPPIVAIALALITKEVLSSLILGIITGAFIYAFGMDQNLLMGTLQATFSTMVKRVDFNIIIFCSLLGALVYVVAMSGASRAYGKWAVSKIKGRKGTLGATAGLGLLIFIDDYFNCLTVGTVMRPLCDQYKIARAKLAYIVDTTAAPVCIIAPVSSWAAAVGSSLKDTGAFNSSLSAFVASIPWNFYALLCLVMVAWVVIMEFDFGPMRKAQENADQGTLTSGISTAEGMPDGNERGTVMDMLIPILSLIVLAVMSLMYSGGYWAEGETFHNFAASMGEASASDALVWASSGALLVAFVMYVPRRLIGFKDFMGGVVEGIKLMLPANLILVLAWTLAGVCRELLQTPQFIEQMVVNSGSQWSLFLPAIIFLIASFLSFSTGTAWGTFGILIPITVPVVQAIDPQLTIVALSATLAGAVFGDHCSPISDTTILSSAGAGCNHIEHVSTQLPYALVVAVATFVGYVVAGFTSANLLLSFGAALATLLIMLVVMRCRDNCQLATA